MLLLVLFGKRKFGLGRAVVDWPVSVGTDAERFGSWGLLGHGALRMCVIWNGAAVAESYGSVRIVEFCSGESSYGSQGTVM